MTPPASALARLKALRESLLNSARENARKHIVMPAGEGSYYAGAQDAYSDVAESVDELLDALLALPDPAPPSAYGVVGAFMRYLGDMHSPEIVLEEDGEIGFDWDVSRGNSLSASVNESGRVSWAVLVDDFSAHGHFTLPDESPEFREACRRVEAVIMATRPDPAHSAQAETARCATCRYFRPSRIVTDSQGTWDHPPMCADDREFNPMSHEATREGYWCNLYEPAAHPERKDGEA